MTALLHDRLTGKILAIKCQRVAAYWYGTVLYQDCDVIGELYPSDDYRLAGTTY